LDILLVGIAEKFDGGDSVSSAYRGKYLGQSVSPTPLLIRFRKYLFGKCFITEDATFLVSTVEFTP